MGRPPGNGVPAFRFIAPEVAEMETILQEHSNAMPSRELLQNLAQKFSDSPDRKGKVVVQFKQIWNWFQNRRYAVRARSSKVPVNYNAASTPRDDSTPLINVPKPVASPIPAPIMSPMPAVAPPASVTTTGRSLSETSYTEYEAKSARDGAWYDVANFLAHRHLDMADPEVQVRFAGFGPEEDEWVNVLKHVRPRSLPCEASECVAVLPGDLVLCFQEGKDQALYFDAHVLDAQRRRHDARGCRCRFLVRYDLDQSEEIVPLRKVCRRPETDYRLQQLHAAKDSAAAEPKTLADPSTALRTFSSLSVTMPKPQSAADQAKAPHSTASAGQIVDLDPKTPGTGSDPINVNPSPAPPPLAPAPVPAAAPVSDLSLAESGVTALTSTPTDSSDQKMQE